jgi:hypothetical protein
VVLPAQGEVVVLTVLHPDHVRVIVAQVMLEQSHLPASGEGADPRGCCGRRPSFGLGQWFRSGGLIVTHEIGDFFWCRQATAACLAGGVAGGGKPGDDGLGVSNEFPVERSDYGSVGHHDVPGVPVGMADNDCIVVSVGEDLVGSATTELIEPLITWGSGAEVNQSVVGYGPGPRLVVAPRWSRTGPSDQVWLGPQQLDVPGQPVREQPPVRCVRPFGTEPTISVSAVTTRPSTSWGPDRGVGQGKLAATSSRWASAAARRASRSAGGRRVLITTARPSASSTPQTASMRPARKRMRAIPLPSCFRA